MEQHLHPDDYQRLHAAAQRYALRLHRQAVHEICARLARAALRGLLRFAQPAQPRPGQRPATTTCAQNTPCQPSY